MGDPHQVLGRRVGRFVAAIALAVLSGGCAVVQELPDGSRRVTGLVSMTIPNPIESDRRGADSLEVKTLGVSVISALNVTSVSVGYSADRITAVRNNAIVEIAEKGSQP